MSLKVVQPELTQVKLVQFGLFVKAVV
jgi:hypothetical protein